MAVRPLVDRLVDSGQSFIKFLDDVGIRPRSALWRRRPDSEDWELVLATSTAGAKGPRAAYEEVLTVYRQHEAELEPLRADDLVVVELDHPLIRLHLVIFNTGPGISRIESSGNAVNGQLLPDSLIYRLQPPEAALDQTSSC